MVFTSLRNIRHSGSQHHRITISTSFGQIGGDPRLAIEVLGPLAHPC